MFLALEANFGTSPKGLLSKILTLEMRFQLRHYAGIYKGIAMTQFLLSAVLLMSSSMAFAQNYSSSNECVNYTNSAFAGAAADVRLSNALLAMNLAFELKFTEKEFGKIESAVATGKVSQDNLEKMAYFGCTEDVTGYDRQIAKETFAFLLK